MNFEIKKIDSITIFKLNEKRLDTSISGLVKGEFTLLLKVEENKKLIQKCADALNKNGQVVIQDYVLDEERISPYSGTLFAINMLVNTQEGDAYTQKEISSWLTDAGLSDLSRNDTSHGASQIIGREKIQSLY